MITSKTILSLIICLNLILLSGPITLHGAEVTKVESTSPAVEQDISTPQMRASYSVRTPDPTTARALEATGVANTSLAGVFRYTCPADSGFLPEQCRADLFPSCSADTPKVALTTDNFLSLRANIDNAQDNDTWTWNWRSPAGTLTFPSTLVFHETFNNENLCFEFSTPFGIHGYVCGGRSISFEWGSGAVRGGAEGVWFVDLSLNGQQLFHEPFELVQPPQVNFTSFSAQNLSLGVLDVNADLIVSPRDPDSRIANVQVVPSTSPPVIGAANYTLQPGPNSLQVNLAQMGIGRFDDDVTLQIRAATPSRCASIPPQQDFAALEIPLPVVFIHGYVEEKLRFSFFGKNPTTWIQAEQADPLFSYLITQSMAQPNTNQWRIPYEVSGGTYPTLSTFFWVNMADSPSETVIQQLQTEINDKLIPTYATHVNLLTHSAGGLVGRLAIANGAPVRKLIMVGCPNNGTSHAWEVSGNYSREKVEQLAKGMAGYLTPRTDSLPFITRGPYQKGGVCTIQPLPIGRRPLPALPSESNRKISNIFTNDDGADTPWDLVATFDKKANWYNFSRRRLQDAQACDPTTTWAFYRTGDGVVSVQDATLGPDYDIRIRTQNTPHHKQLGNTLVRQAIARALGLIE